MNTTCYRVQVKGFWHDRPLRDWTPAFKDPEGEPSDDESTFASEAEAMQMVIGAGLQLKSESVSWRLMRITGLRLRSRAPGENIREEDRNTVAVKLRLPPATAARLDELCSRLGVNRSRLVEFMLARI